MINRLEVKRRGFAPQARIAATVNEATVNFSDGHSRSPFGAITSWVWSFGDGQFATGPEATHTYGRTGFFEVLLMVVDSTGRRASTTKRVWVTVPNSAPTAAFFTSGTGLTVNFDASASSDGDGQIVSYAWTFGDAQTGRGMHPVHTFSGPGTYNVTLTVTDDRGATGTATRPITVIAPPVVLASDAFDRTVTNGWGTADVGGPWTVGIDADSHYSVANGEGKQRIPGAGRTLRMNLAGVSSESTDLRFQVGADKLPSHNLFVRGVVRRVDTAEYAAQVTVRPDGTTELHLNVAGSPVVGGTISGVTLAPGERLNVAVQANGVSPTLLQAKVWKAGTPEPSEWQYSRSDSTSGLQAAGSIGLNCYLSSSATNAPIEVSFAQLAASTQAPPTPQVVAGPRSFSTIPEARAYFGMPEDAEYVTWDEAVARTGESDFWRICKKMSRGPGGTGAVHSYTNWILVLPERTNAFGIPDPYPIDGSRGFMSSEWQWITGANYEQTIEAGAQPINIETGLTLELGRCGRGVMGMGPNSVMEVVGTRSTQRIPDPRPQGDSRRNTDDDVWLRKVVEGQVVRNSSRTEGLPYRLISAQHVRPEWANFVLRCPQGFGPAMYNGLSASSQSSASASLKHSRVQNVLIDGAWRGDKYVPNGEAGGVTFYRGTCEMKDVLLRCPATLASSPIMYNRNTGTTAKGVRIVDQSGNTGGVTVGMVTVWGDTPNCQYTFEDCDILGWAKAMNVEDLGSGSTVKFKDCRFTVIGGGAEGKPLGPHIQIKPSNGSIPITLENCTFNKIGDFPGPVFTVYDAPGKQKRSDMVVTPTGPAITYLNPSQWIA